ncbi:hypothetical protein CRM22_001417 [Opisthorchis felineus]|uniref:Acetyl-CoA acetyltransferase n=1 Tax=Opisthorchis felineus TaxID=147828 RepID=A0A4S2MAQ3_OPIFE|nr:hypothetical protein CRM22_001417 [Opisthorchis felineus]
MSINPGTFCPDDVFIVAARRSPIGRKAGSLSGLAAHQLGGQVITAVLQDAVQAASSATLTQESLIQSLDEVIIGQVFTAAAGQNPARQAAVLAGIPYSIPAWGVNMLCGSGLRTVCLAYDQLKVTKSSCGGWIIAGGQESMSQSPYCIPSNVCLRHRDEQTVCSLPHLDTVKPTNTVIQDGLMDAFCGILMGETAEVIAERYNIDRQQQDQFAVNSQKKYAAAKASGYFDAELTPIEVPAKGGGDEVIIVTTDEHPRPDISMESLSRLKPAFAKSDRPGTVTAGNASGINDGAAFLLLCRGDQLLTHGIQHPMARIVGWHQVGLEPQLMALGPLYAIQGLLDRIGWTIDMVDVFEVNEAFAVQCIAVMRELNIPPEKVNLQGGGIALGHPLGCSGARVLVTLVHLLQRLKRESPDAKVLRGVAALCVGGGMGIAIAVESSAS